MSDDTGIGGEALLPKRLAENDKTVLTGEVFAGAEGPSECDVGAEDREEFGGHERAVQADRVAETGQIELIALHVARDVHRA
jgi:hypothetical protein